MKTIVERLFTKAGQETESGCWEWQGCVTRNGYGQLHYQGSTAYAHRVSFELTHGKPPEGLDVCHTCDNRRCINPSHLFAGTRGDNMADAVGKNRQAQGVRNGRSKLSEKTVLEIRSASGSQAAIAREFGISQASVSLIRNGQTWRHVL